MPGIFEIKSRRSTNWENNNLLVSNRYLSKSLKEATGLGFSDRMFNVSASLENWSIARQKSAELLGRRSDRQRLLSTCVDVDFYFIFFYVSCRTRSLHDIWMWTARQFGNDFININFAFGSTGVDDIDRWALEHLRKLFVVLHSDTRARSCSRWHPNATETIRLVAFVLVLGGEKLSVCQTTRWFIWVPVTAATVDQSHA